MSNSHFSKSRNLTEGEVKWCQQRKCQEWTILEKWQTENRSFEEQSGEEVYQRIALSRSFLCHIEHHCPTHMEVCIPRDRGLNLKPVNEAVFLSSCTSSSCTRSYWFLERMVLRRPFGLLHVFLSLSGMQGSDYSFLGPFLRVMFTESNLDGWCYVCLWDKAGLLTACYKKGGFPTSVFLSGRAHPQRVEHLSETGHTLFMPGRGKPT